MHERHAPAIFATLCMLTRRTRTAAAPSCASPGTRRRCCRRRPRARELPVAASPPPLGRRGRRAWRRRRVALPRDWALLLYTDGLIEGRTARAPSGSASDGSSAARSARRRRRAARRRLAAARRARDRGRAAHGGALADDVARWSSRARPLTRPVSRPARAPLVRAARRPVVRAGRRALGSRRPSAPSLGVVAVVRLTDARDERARPPRPGACSRRCGSRNALLNQETGVRGYALTGREQFLEPYRSGRATERRRSPRSARLPATTSSRGPPRRRARARAAAAWRARLRRADDRAVRAPAEAPDAPSAERGQARFDAVRAALATAAARPRRGARRRAARASRSTARPASPSRSPRSSC